MLLQLKFSPLTIMPLFLLALSDESCAPNRFYCGSEVPGVMPYWMNQTLWKCRPSGISFDRSFDCKWGCKNIQNANSYCLCLENSHYCGHQLNNIGWQGYENNSIYKCDDKGSNASLIENCPNQCQGDTNQDSAEDGDQNRVIGWCSGHCQCGTNYCGYKLKEEFGWDGYENDTLYHCHGGNKTTIWTKCPPGTCHSNRCKCNPGQYYCSHELDDQLGWKGLKSRRMELHKCEINGTSTKGIASCNYCNKTSTALTGDQRPTCECKTGHSYCGRKLQEMGYDGYDNDTLYGCRGGNEMTVLSKCPPGMCQSHYCKCNPGQYYCGSQLPHRTSAFPNTTLWECWPDGIILTRSFADCSFGCNIHDNNSYCFCKENSHYCGHQLKDLGWQGYQDHSLYKCEDGFNASLIENCTNQCEINRDGEDQDVEFGRCSSHCQSGRNYCGYRLKEEFGWDGYENDTLYRCRGGNETIIRTKCPPGTCQYDHCKCNPGQYYCGHELFEQLGWRSFKFSLMELHQCTQDGTTIGISFCNQCNSTSTAQSGHQRPTCNQQCKIGSTYCGYGLHAMGWNGYDNSTLYICEEGQNIRELMACGDGKCRDNGHCECTRNKLYCGHELYKMGWRKITSAEDQARLGRCTDGSDAEWIAFCNQCNSTQTALTVSGDQRPTCECKTGNIYCGNTLQEMGWNGYDNDTLYHCGGNGTSVQLKCPTGCHSRISDRCNCNPGQYYCGHELSDQLAWNIHKSRQQDLFKCASDGSRVFDKYDCQQCIIGQPRPICECEMGKTYCGLSLQEMGWDGYKNDTLYNCGGGNESSVWLKCPTGMCQYGYLNRCKCNPGQYYCGHELSDQLGWTNYKSKQQILFKCASDGDGAYVESEDYACQQCISGHPRPICKCHVGSTYCGQMLHAMGYDGYDNDALYLCEQWQINGTRISKLADCGEGKCDNGYCKCTLDKLYCGHELYQMGWRHLTSVENQAKLARCTEGGNVDFIEDCHNCSNTGSGSKCDCTPGLKYCGSQLNQDGYEGYKNDSIYLCEDAGLPISDTGVTNILCSQDCIPGRKYCGHKVQYIQNIANDDRQRLYICEDNKSFRSTSKCRRCIANDATGAYCACMPDWRLCGRDVLGQSWVTGNLPNNITNDTIFHCKDEENMEYVESCGRNECIYKHFGGAYCQCSPNRTYCGHELYEYYNSNWSTIIKLDPNYIYRCSETTSTVIEEERCRKCSRLDDKPYCEHEFSTWFIGGIVSGIAALVGRLLYWSNMNTLYCC